MTAENIDVFRSVHPNHIKPLKSQEMSIKPGEAPIRGDGGAAPGQERRAGKPRVVRETSLTRHPHLGAAKFG